MASRTALSRIEATDLVPQHSYRTPQLQRPLPGFQRHPLNQRRSVCVLMAWTQVVGPRRLAGVPQRPGRHSVPFVFLSVQRRECRAVRQCGDGRRLLGRPLLRTRLQRERSPADPRIGDGSSCGGDGCVDWVGVVLVENVPPPKGCVNAHALAGSFCPITGTYHHHALPSTRPLIAPPCLQAAV